MEMSNVARFATSGRLKCDPMNISCKLQSSCWKCIKSNRLLNTQCMLNSPKIRSIKHVLKQRSRGWVHTCDGTKPFKHTTPYKVRHAGIPLVSVIGALSNLNICDRITLAGVIVTTLCFL